MKTKYVDFLNEDLDYSKFINNNELTIRSTQIDLKDLAIEKYKDLSVIIIEKCKVLNQDIDFSIFQKLKRFACSNSQLTTLPDLSKCRLLEKLKCFRNQLTTLPDLSNCGQLKGIICFSNQLTSLPDLSKCSQLDWLNCDDNQLTTLPDLSKCSQLKELFCYNNQLTSLPDLSKCRLLEKLRCENNQLTKLPDLSKCSQLEMLYCYNNQLTTLPDLNKCSQLRTLDCYNNQLTSCKSFYSLYKFKFNFNFNFNISNNPIPKIEVDFVENKSNIVNYYWQLFIYCIKTNISLEKFKIIEWPKDFYDNYISKVTTQKQKRYIGYLTHSKDVSNLNDDLFSF